MTTTSHGDTPSTRTGTKELRLFQRAANLANVNGTLFFRATDGTTGTELWKSDGTEAGTVRVKDINTGIDSPGTTSSSLLFLTNVNGTLFFRATDGTTGPELWRSDGTEAGTVRVKDINPGTTGSNPFGLTNVNGTLFFTATDTTGGTELWKSDGTEAGTVRVKDINPGSSFGFVGSSFPSNLTNVNGTLFFSAADGTTGAELWAFTPNEAPTNGGGAAPPTHTADARAFGTVISSPNSPTVLVLNTDGSARGSFAPFGTVGARTAFGDITGDGVEDLLVTQASGGSLLLIFDGATGARIAQAPLFAPGNGSATVAAGDVTGDGRADILAGSSVGGRVRVFDGATGALLADAVPFAGFAGAFHVAAGDLNGDGLAELVLAASSGRTQIFDPVRGVIADGSAFGAFGAAVAVGDLDGDGSGDLILASQGGTPAVRIVRGNGTITAFSPALLGTPLSAAAVDVDRDGRADIVLGSGTSGVAVALAGDDLALLGLIDFGFKGVFVG